MTVRFGEFAIRTHFLVVPSLAVECILGTAYTNRYVKSIYCIDREVELLDGTTVSIQAIYGEDGDTQPTAEKESPPPRRSNKIRVARAIRIPPLAEAEVWVQTEYQGKCFVQGDSKPYVAKGLALANGVAAAKPNQPFRVRVMNLSRVPRFLPKTMVLGRALPHPRTVIYLVPNGPPVLQTQEDKPEGDWKSKLALDHLVEDMKARVTALLERHESMWDGHLGTISATSHNIDLLPASRPVFSQPYRAGARARTEEAAEIERMKQLEVIEPSYFEWASPVVLVPKSDGSLRFCVEYRKLNAPTARDSYPLLRMYECIDSLGDATVFTTLDCNSGYWQIPVATQDQDKTTFTSHFATYRFKRMPFGLKNAPATFQRAIDIILAGVKWQHCLVYLDDVIAFSKSMESHL